MQVSQKTQEWGNSTGIRLPRKVLQAANWQLNQEVKIDVRGNKVVLTPVGKPGRTPTLKELMAGVTPENVHKETDWGGPAGNEIW